MQEQSAQKLSTSALAKVLEIPSQQLFSTFKDYGWIRKLESGWALTGKGEFEGGEYVHSKRYGRYIVWPEELVSHPLLQAIEDNRHTSASALGKSHGLGAREVNRLLAELGWIKHGFQGWELTALGESEGGVQLENENSGTFYVVWPQNVQDNRLLKKQLQYAAEVNNQIDSESDLFAGETEFHSLDGHNHTDRALHKICHWLYMAGIAHACQRNLPVDEEISADFYLPAHQLYIEYWGDDGSRGKLAQRMKRKELYQSLQLAVIDLDREDLLQLDEVLTRQLRKRGIRIY